MFVDAPPAWDEIAKSQEFQSLTPNEKANVQRRWVFDRMNYDYDRGNEINQKAMVKEFKKYGFEPTTINTGFKDFTDYRSYMEGQQAEGLQGKAREEALSPNYSFGEGLLVGSQQAAGALGAGLVRPFEGMAGVADMTVGKALEAVVGSRMGIDKLANNLHSIVADMGRGVETDVIHGFSDGGFWGGVNALTNMVLMEAPNQIIQLGIGAAGIPQPYALAMLGASSMGSEYNELKNDKSLSELQKYSIATLNGTIEGLTELMDSIPFVKRMTSSTKQAIFREALRSKPIRTMAKEFLKTFGGEALEESTGEFLQNVSEAVIRGEKINWKDLGIQVANAGIGGGAMGGMMGVGGVAYNRHVDSERTSRKAFQEIGALQSGINPRAKDFNQIVKSFDLPDKYSTREGRRKAIDNYDFHGEPISFGEEATDEERITALKERIAWYDNIKDNIEDGNEKAEWDEYYKEWTNKLEALQNKQNEQQEPEEQLPPPVDENGNELGAEEVTKESHEPPKEEPPKEAFKAKGETTEERISSLVEHVHSPKPAQHADGSAGGSFVTVVMDIASGGDVKTSSDKNYGKSNLVLQNKENGAQRDIQIAQMKKSPIWKDFFGDDWTHKGSPIIGMDGNTESGNTRLDVLRQLYLEGKADEYRSMVEEVAKQLGISTEGMTQPAVVRVNVTEMTDAEREDFVRRANKNLEMRQLSEANQAQDDAKAFADHQEELLSLYHAPDDMTKIIGSGKDDLAFLNRFRELVGANPGDVDENANYTESFFKRIRNTFLGALFNQLPNGRGLIKEFTNTDEMKTVLNGLVPVVPRLLKQATANPEYDITPILGEALRQLKRYKEERNEGKWKTPEDYARQGDLWDSERYMSPAETEMFLNLAYISSMKEMRQLMKQYMEQVDRNTDNAKQGSLNFGDEPEKLSREEIIKNMAGYVKKRQIQEGGSAADAYMENGTLEDVEVPLVDGATVERESKPKAKRSLLRQNTQTTEEDNVHAVEIEKAAKDVADGFGFQVVVHKDNADIPADVQDDLAEFGDGAIAEAWIGDDGIVHLVASQLESSEAAVRKVLHEIVGHNGLAALFKNRNTDAWNDMVEKLWEGHKNDIMNRCDAYVGAEGFDINTNEGRGNLVEEWLARLAESNRKPMWWRTVVSRVRSLLRACGIEVAYSDADIRQLLADAATAARKVTGKTGNRYSVDNSQQDRYTLDKAIPSKEGYKVERVNETCGDDLNNAHGVVCESDIIYKTENVPSTKSIKWIKNAVQNYAAQHEIIGKHETPCLGDGVRVEVGGIKNTLNHFGSDIKNNLVAVIPQMLKNAVLIQTERDKTVKTHLLAAKVKYGNDSRYIVGMVIHENNGKFYYDHELVEIEKAGLEDPSRQTTGVFSKPATVISVIQNALLSSGFDKNNSKNRFSVAKPVQEGTTPLPSGPNPSVSNVLQRAAKSPIDVRHLHALRLPLIMELAKQLGSNPKAVDRIPIMKGAAKGVFYEGSERLIKVIRSLVAPHRLGMPVITTEEKADEQIAIIMDYWTHRGIPEDEIEIIQNEIEGQPGKTKIITIWHDKSQAMLRKTLAHEVGHLIDYNAGETTSHGNVLGTVGGIIKGYLKHIIAEDPKNPIDWKAFDKRKRELHKQAEKAVGKRPADKNAQTEWREKVSAEYEQRLIDECNNNGMFRLAVIKDELVQNSAWWRGEWGEDDPNYARYRMEPTELFADAMSILLNAPDKFRKQLPETWRMLQNYQSEREDFHKAWQGMMRLMENEEAYTQTLMNLSKQGYTADEKTVIQINKEKASTLRALKRTFVDSFAEVNDAAKKMLRSGEEKMDNLPISSIAAAQHQSIKDYYLILAERLAKPLSNAGITDEQIGLYLENQRIVNDPSINKGHVINPHGLDIHSAELNLKQLHSQLGEEKWNMLEDWHKKFWKLRQDTIIKMIEQSGMFNKELVNHIRKNEWYSYRAVIDQIYNADGTEKPGVGKIYGLKGTFSPIANPLGWTYDHDLRLMGSILWNVARRDTIQFMKENFPMLVQRVNPYSRNKSFVPAGYVRLTVLESNKPVDYNVAEAWATGFTSRLNTDTATIMHTIQGITNLYRRVWTMLSPTFLLNNLVRDYLASFQNISGINKDIGAIEWTKCWFQGMKEAFGFNFGKGSEVIEEMMRRNMFQSGGKGYDMSTRNGEETGSKRMDLLRRYGMVKDYDHENIAKRYVEKIGDFIERLVDATEKGAKAGGFLALQKNNPSMSDAEKQWHIIRHIGSPDFAQRGTATPITNTLFIFSNAAIQGWNGTLEMAKANPKAFAARWMATTGTAVLIGWLLESGAMRDMLKGAGMDDDDDTIKLLDWLQKMFGKITHYNRYNYMCLPFAEREDGYVWTLRLPFAENSKLPAMIMHGALDEAYTTIKKDKNFINEIFDAGLNQSPNVNPLGGLIRDVSFMLAGRNPRDFFRGREAVKSSEWDAGGMTRLWGSLKYLVHEYTPLPLVNQMFDLRDNPYWWWNIFGGITGIGAWFKPQQYGEAEQNRAVTAEKRKKKLSGKTELFFRKAK